MQNAVNAKANAPRGVRHTLLVHDAHPKDRDHLLQRHPLILEHPSTLAWKHRAHQMLSLLPPEIVERIVAFACTDGGPTAAALLRCSRFIAAVALPHCFRNVAVAGFVQLPRFLEAYRSAVQRDPAISVQRLFVSDVTQTQAEAGVVTSNLFNPASLDTGPEQDEAYKTQQRNFRLLRKLFRCVGPGVRTVTVVLHDDWFMGLFVRGGPMTELPALEELSIACMEPRHTSSHSWPHMPRLRTLRLGLRGAPLRSSFYTVLSIEFGRPVRLVLRDFGTDPDFHDDVPFVVRSLLGEAEGERTSPIEHLEIWPDAALAAMKKTRARYGARLTVMAADPHKWTWAEWKAASF